uniref:Homocysteine S-methyltransferase n=1 Tax=Angomonas desouzai TaxID=59800 RepID=U5KN53_9TRYP|nr:homocysteine S-methyltransferase [Angomonas desouzai]
MAETTKMDFKAYMEDPRSILVLDGALATELQSRGCDLNDPLWSGKTLIEEPTAIAEVEKSYLQSGARCIITASYQATPEILELRRNISSSEAYDIIKRSVQLAKQARDTYYKVSCEKPRVFVAGSVGPYGALLADGSEYRGDYQRTAEEFKSFHRDRMRALASAGADLFALETQPSAPEVRALVDLIETEFPNSQAWVSFTVKEGDPSAMSDGTPFADIVPLLDASPNIVAIGVNCLPLMNADASLSHLAALTKKPLVVYPNSGEQYDPNGKGWSGAQQSGTLAGECEKWLHHGARVIGGCCRTTPADIKELTQKLVSLNYICSK